MQRRQLGNSDLWVSPVCLGTMTFGDQNTQEDANGQMDYALSQGINFIDTAEMYPVPPKAETFTRTETMIGHWLKHKKRDEIILGSKVAGRNRGLSWIRNGDDVLNRENIRAAIHDSLKRLQTDYIDLYQIHWPERNVPLFGQYQFDPQGEKDAQGNVTVVHCEYLPDTKSGTPGSDSVKVKGNIHWVSANHAYQAEVRMYDRLFKDPHPGSGDKDFLDDINPDSVKTITAQLEQSAQAANAGDIFQFERHGYFVADRKDSTAGKPVFNRTVTLKDTWQK